MKAAALLAASLLSGLSLAGGAQARTTLAPTPAAIAHWKQASLAPAHLSAWWRGYLSQPRRLTGCRYDSAGGTTTYDCRIVKVSVVLGFAALARTGSCSYLYVFREAGGTHQIARSLHFCG